MALKKYLFEIWILPSRFAHWVDVEIASTFHLWLAIPNDSTKFCNLLWCVLAPSSIDNEGFVALHWVFFHFVWLFKVWLTLNLFQDLMHWFLEHSANHLGSNKPWLPSKVSSGLIIVISVRPEISYILRYNLSFPFPLLLVFLDPFILVHTVHERRPLLTGFLVNDFLKSCPAGRLTLEVLMATSSKSPSISLNIS